MAEEVGGFLSTLKLDGRFALSAAIAVATALGCTTKTVVVEPPDPGNGPAAAPIFSGIAIQATTAPLPISGGTLITQRLADRTVAIVADPEEDSISIVDISSTVPAVLGTVALQRGDEPGRLVADSAGRVHVVLRSGGAIATILPTNAGGSLVARRTVCNSPRGIDYDTASDSLFVTCATGELMQAPASGGDAALVAQLDRDLRDVVVDGNTLQIARFRSAELLTVSKAGAIIKRQLPPMPSFQSAPATPDVAWRLVPRIGGGVHMVHQLASTLPINIATPPGVSSYGGGGSSNSTEPIDTGGGGVVTVAVASIGGPGQASSIALTSNPVVDGAEGPNGFLTVSIGGRIELVSPNQPTTQTFDITGVDTGSSTGTPDQFVAIADATNQGAPVVVVQRRGASPALLVLSASKNTPIDTTTFNTVVLPQNTSHVDTGLDAFTMPTTAGIACMSCHPEGSDDSHTWSFQNGTELRVRRTQSLRGGVIVSSAPYHWDGDMADLQILCNEVFTHRMGGGSMLSTQTSVLSRFINAIPRVPVRATLDQTRVAAGQDIFQGLGGCVGCHAGPTASLSANMDIGKVDKVGARVPLQVPMLLGVADRAPYMHDGCADSLMARLTNPSCAGAAHGNTADLSADDKQSLVEYLESL